MLEPDNTTSSTTSTTSADTAGPQPDPTGADASTQTPADPPAPRKRAPRKRAVTKAVPVTDAGTVPAEGAAPEVAAAEPSAAASSDLPAKPVRKRAVKKAAPAADGAAEQPATAEGEAPAKRARKRAAKKAAAAPAEGVEPAAEAAPPVLAAPGVLFVAPSAAESEQPRRRRPSKKAAAAAVEQAEDAETTAPGGPAEGEHADPAAQTVDSADSAPSAAPEGEDDPDADPDTVKEAAIEQASGARRRRRRGRRGRGGVARSAEDADDEDAPEAEDDESPAGEDVDAEATEDEADGADGETGSSSSRRRRRRRRAGSADTGGDGDDPANTVTHVREPKAKNSDDGDDGVRGVKGSTRLEAKRQRRRDGRDTNRRRAPILTESEFLARREAVDRVMAVRQAGDRTQIAVLEDDVLVEHYVTRASATSYVGNVYLGRVQNVLPSMEAAFIDIGKGRNGVLYAGEVNWDVAGLEGKSRAIENALKSGDSVLVQVTKDPIGHKGARLTSQISLPGRFLVLVPGGGMTGISRRLPDTERHRLKSILKKIVPDDAGVIVRTAAEGASEEDLTRDVERLTAQWEKISASAATAKNGAAPTLVHGEPDIAIRVVRDVFNEDFKKLVVQGDEAWATISDYLTGVAPDLAERASRHTAEGDLFHDLRVDEQLAKALDRKVWLPSGGSLVIDRTEAMTVVDVNTGKFIGSGGNLEQTVTRNNLEAAEEIVRQLRLRDVGGIVVIDFIDMVLESNRELVLRRLTECLGRDRTKHQVAEVTSLGLVQMTRKRVGEGLLEAFSEPCEHCRGRGVIVRSEPVDRPAGSGDFEDDDRPAGKSRRRRGKGGGAAAEPVEPVPATNDEQRRAATAAIDAIHRAAAGELDDPSSDAVQAAADGLLDAARVATGADEVGAAGERAPETARTEPVAPSGCATEAPAESASAGSAVSHDVPVTQPEPVKRRRRVAVRETAAPPAAEPVVVVIEQPEAQAAATEPTAGTETPVASVEGGEPAAVRRPRPRRAASRPAGPPVG